jgi:hypothetical protein
MLTYPEIASKSASAIISVPTDTKSPTPIERLPFKIRLATNDEQLQRVAQVRYQAYARHVPQFAESLRKPEPQDFSPGTLVLLAESKFDGAPLGTMRIQTNRYEPLGMEQSVTLPDWLQGVTLLEATRLGVAEGRIGRAVKASLLKACFSYCKQDSVDWMVITARKPLDRQYEALMFEDVFSAGEFIPMPHVGNIEHRVMAINVHTAEARWANARHPLHQFMCRTIHPDIDLAQDDVMSLLPMVIGAAPLTKKVGLAA